MTVNKVLNMLMSQLVESRTFRSFGMNFYDATTKPSMPNFFSSLTDLGPTSPRS